MPTTLDSRQLLAFATLAETGSFTETAKRLFLTQSAISHSIKGLENDLDCQLFTRVGKRTHLSEAGERFLPTAHRILQDMEGARREISLLKDPGQTRLRIGASTTACQTILPPVLKELKRKFPMCSIVIVATDTPKAIEDVVENRTDIALTLAPEGIHKCCFYPLFQDELRYIVPHDHPWALSSRVNREELGEQNYILYNKSSYTFRQIQAYFQKSEAELKNYIELGSNEAIKELIKNGTGIGILASWMVQKEIDDGTLVSFPLGRTKLKRTWGVSYARGKKLTSLEESFIAICENSIQSLKREKVIAS